MEAQTDPNGSTPNTEVDIENNPAAKKLVTICRAFFSEIDNLYVISAPTYPTNIG
jgi:hypothetical protein